MHFKWEIYPIDDNNQGNFFPNLGHVFSIFQKILLNVKKTEIVIFKSKQEKFESDLKIKLCRKRLYPTASVKYLGVKTDTDLNWKYHVNDFSINWIEPMLSSSKWENLLVLKCYDSSILLFLTPVYPTAVLSDLRIVALFNKL